MNKKLQDVLTILGVLLIIYLVFLMKDMLWGPILGMMAPAFVSFTSAFFIAWLLNPIVKWLRSMGVRKGISVMIALAVPVVAIVILVTSIIPLLDEQIRGVATAIPGFLEWLTEVVPLEELDQILYTLEEYVMNNLEQITTSVTSGVAIVLGTLYSGASGIVGVFGTIFLSGILVVFLLADYEKIVKNIYEMFPQKHRERGTKTIRKIGKAANGYVKGVALIAIILATVCFIGFSIARLNYAFLFSVIIGITNVVPYIGPFVGGTIVVLFALFQSGRVAVITLIIIVVLQSLESAILRPYIMAKTVKLHPVMMILGLSVFSKLLGILGMIIAPVIIAVGQILYKEIKDIYKKRRNIEIEQK